MVYNLIPAVALLYLIEQVKEEKYSYMMRRWHSMMLGLPELSSSLSTDTNTQIVQVFSFFVQSCLEDNQIAELLNNFYRNKARMFKCNVGDLEFSLGSVKPGVVFSAFIHLISVLA